MQSFADIKVHVEYDGQGITLVRADEYHMRAISSLRLVTCDIALFDGTMWVTPKTPLLKGTMRQAMRQQTR